MELSKVSIYKLNPAVHNPRIDLRPGDEEYNKLKLSIETFGCVQAVVWNKRSGNIVGGHQTLKVLKELGHTRIDCVAVDLDEPQEKTLNIALNKISGHWDDEKLAVLLDELKQTEADISLTGFDDAEINKLISQYMDSDIPDDDFDVDTALPETPITNQGDMWYLGNHRVMCGDSCDPEQVAKLMDGEKAQIIITDPPYNVDYEGNAGKITNDSMPKDAFRQFLLAAFNNMYKFSVSGAAVYVFHADGESLNFRTAFIDAGFLLKQCLIWVKNHFVMGRQDYQWKHEPILYGWKDGAAHYFVDDRSQDTILLYDRPMRSDEHPTMKPIPLLCKLIENSSLKDWIVADFFGGSGSTLAACEMLGRSARIIELDPKYADVIVKRYVNMTDDNTCYRITADGDTQYYNDLFLI